MHSKPLAAPLGIMIGSSDMPNQPVLPALSAQLLMTHESVTDSIVVTQGHSDCTLAYLLMLVGVALVDILVADLVLELGLVAPVVPVAPPGHCSCTKVNVQGAVRVKSRLVLQPGFPSVGHACV